MTPLATILIIAVAIGTALNLACLVVLLLRTSNPRPVSLRLMQDKDAPGTITVSEVERPKRTATAFTDPGKVAREARLERERMEAISGMPTTVGTVLRSDNPLERDEVVEVLRYE